MAQQFQSSREEQQFALNATARETITKVKGMLGEASVANPAAGGAPPTPYANAGFGAPKPLSRPASSRGGGANAGSGDGGVQAGSPRAQSPRMQAQRGGQGPVVLKGACAESTPSAANTAAMMGGGGGGRHALQAPLPARHNCAPPPPPRAPCQPREAPSTSRAPGPGCPPPPFARRGRPAPAPWPWPWPTRALPTPARRSCSARGGCARAGDIQSLDRAMVRLRRRTLLVSTVARTAERMAALTVRHGDGDGVR